MKVDADNPDDTPFKAFLDDIEVRDCFAADDEAGWVMSYITRDGIVLTASKNGQVVPAWVCKHGTVRIERHPYP